ncbi:MAG: hypothetical protein JOY97_03530 [Hyphomicrobiales bacterium]|nr:hypothetical protein [Hyphomicrobiales bacterium]
MRKAWLLLVPLVVGGCQSTNSGRFSTTVPIDEERTVARYYSLHEDCTSYGPAVVRVTNQPAHGTVSIRDGRDYPYYPTSNPRNACNRQSVPMTLVYYRAAAGYSGLDGFAVDAILASGVNRQEHINITVK